MNNPFMPTYESLKAQIVEKEIKYNMELDNAVKDLRMNSYTTPYTSLGGEKYTGKTFISTNCGEFFVAEYFNYDKILIIFKNSGYRMLARANNIQKGEVKDPYARSILGVGCIGIGPYAVDGSAFERMIYSRWRNILDRCYVKCEGNKTVNAEWHNFQYFAAWFHAEFYSIPYYSMYDMCVDKDILYPSNEEYSPYKCLIIPGFINSRVQIKQPERDQINRMLAGTMSSFELQAFFKYKEAKEAHIRKMAETYKDILPPHVYLAIKNYRLT